MSEPAHPGEQICPAGAQISLPSVIFDDLNFVYIKTLIYNKSRQVNLGREIYIVSLKNFGVVHVGDDDADRHFGESRGFLPAGANGYIG